MKSTLIYVLEKIWGGHHRAASLAALEMQEAEVVLLEDTRVVQEPGP